MVKRSGCVGNNTLRLRRHYRRRAMERKHLPSASDLLERLKAGRQTQHRGNYEVKASQDAKRQHVERVEGTRVSGFCQKTWHDQCPGYAVLKPFAPDAKVP